MFDLLHIPPLFYTKISALHQFGKPDDGVHGGADFMGHVGQEVALSLRRCLSCFSLALSFLFFFSLGDVDKRAFQIGRLTVRIIGKVSRAGAPEMRAIFPNKLGLPFHNSAFLHDFFFKQEAVFRVDVAVLGNAVDTLHQFVRRFVAEGMRQ